MHFACSCMHSFSITFIKIFTVSKESTGSVLIQQTPNKRHTHIEISMQSVKNVVVHITVWRHWPEASLKKEISTELRRRQLFTVETKYFQQRQQKLQAHVFQGRKSVDRNWSRQVLRPRVLEGGLWRDVGAGLGCTNMCFVFYHKSKDRGMSFNRMICANLNHKKIFWSFLWDMSSSQNKRGRWGRGGLNVFGADQKGGGVAGTGSGNSCTGGAAGGCCIRGDMLGASCVCEGKDIEDMSEMRSFD